MRAKTRATKPKRVGVSFRFEPDVYAGLKAESEKSGVAMTKIIERTLRQKFAA